MTYMSPPVKLVKPVVLEAVKTADIIFPPVVGLGPGSTAVPPRSPASRIANTRTPRLWAPGAYRLRSPTSRVLLGLGLHCVQVQHGRGLCSYGSDRHRPE